MADKKEYVKLWVSYESYFEAFSDVEVGRLVRAMMKYRVSREEPKFNGNERFIWPAIRRDIDESLEAQESISAARSEAGKQGGRPKAKKANAFEESKKSHGQGQGQGQGHGHGQGQGQDNSARARDPALAAVIDAYRSRICATPSTSSMDELKGYVERMGPECCQKAIDAAVDAGVRSWAYVRSILQAREAQGVKSLEDWQRADEEHERRKKANQPVKKGQITSTDPAKLKADMDWMEEFLKKTGG